MNWEERKQYYDKDYFDTETKPPYRDWWWSDPSVWSPRARAIYIACKPKNLLDCGCAKGSLVKYLVALYNVDAYGFDLSEYAIQTTPYPEILSRLKIFDCAENDLPYEDRQFEVSVCIDFFEHQDNEHICHVVSEIERVTDKFIIIRQPFVNTEFNCKALLNVMEGMTLKQRFDIFSASINGDFISDPENIEHPNTMPKQQLSDLFSDFVPYEFSPYFYDILMGNTYSELSPVFPFYETLIMQRRT